jgi:hypothetical protein
MKSPVEDALVIAHEAALAKLEEYARARQKDVARGAETPALAGLIVQKYGYGLVEAFQLIAERLHDGSRIGPTYSDVDRAVAMVDPDWRENQQKRWAARPASLDAE